MSTVFIYDKLYIPQELVLDTSLLKKYWEFPVFDEPMCKPCPNKPERLNNQCKVCPGYKKTIKMWNTFSGLNGVNYYTVPAGCINENFRKLNIDPSKVTILDKRCDLPFVHDLKFTGTLRTGEIVNGLPTANQQYLVDKWLEKGGGIIEAQPRTGKTVIGVYLSCFLGKKTLFTANQGDLLLNFYKTYETMTNLLELRAQTGKQIVKVVEKMSDLDKEDYDVILVNYQKFIKDASGQARIEKYLKNKYAFVGVDECHTSAATCFSKFVNQLTPSHTLGLSATPDRKDCVSGDTLVYTEVGVLSMSEIFRRRELGERLRVYSQNEVTGEIELKPILEVHAKKVRSHKQLTINDKTLLTTEDHLLY